MKLIVAFSPSLVRWKWRRVVVALAMIATNVAVIAPAGQAADRGKPRIGVILGGGGETGLAWETGVLSALADRAGLTHDKVTVVVGTSAGALVGDHFARGGDLARQVQRERTGDVVSAPVAAGKGMSSIPPEIFAALLSTEGTIEERGRRIGKLAIKAAPGISSADLVAFVGTMMPSSEWPTKVDLRVTTVNAETGQTVLWRRHDGVPLAAAVASSVAVPGFMPAVEIKGAFYTDAPRTAFSPRIAAELKLDAIVYIGMPTSNLSNTVEEEALKELAGKGLKVVQITGGADAAALAANALDPSLRPRAVETGLKDGAASADAVAALLR